MIRLFVIEDNATIIVAGFKKLFYPKRDGIIVCGQSDTVEEAIISADPNEFDIFILDLWLENRKPLINIRRLKNHFPDKPIIIYTSEISLAWKNRMFEEKAMAYVSKKAGRSQIKTAIDTVAKGEVYFPVDLSQLSSKNVQVTIGGKTHILTSAQVEIIQLLKKGLTHQEIADLIRKSESRLEQILKELRDELSCKNNIQLLTILGEFDV